MNIQGHRFKNRMNLEQALFKYANDISYLILRDGTSIEIIDNEENERYEPEQNNYDDEFMEEKIVDNHNYDNYDNYQFKEINQEGTLRGKTNLKKSLGKSLRKTLIKTITKENQGKLRSNKKDIILKQTENNEYLQCANCFKFFDPNENIEENNYKYNDLQLQEQINNNKNNNKVNPPIANQIPSHQIPQPKQMIPNQQKHNQFQNQQFYPQIPNQQKKPEKIPRGPPNQIVNYPPPQPQPYQRNYYNNIPKGNFRPNQAMPPFHQNNQIFRASNRNSGRYQPKENIIQKEMIINKYPGSGKKPRNNNFNYEQNNGNDRITRDFNKIIGEEVGYTDNNLDYYYDKNNNNNNYYEYPQKKYFPSSRPKKENNYYQEEKYDYQQQYEYYEY